MARTFNMTNDLDATLAAWAHKHPEIVSLFVFGSRARSDARLDSDLDLAFELDDARETPLTVLAVSRGQWQQELSALTGLVVRDLCLWNDWNDRPVSAPVKEVYWRGMNEMRVNAKKQRKVYGYWHWYEKQVGEWGASTSILKAAGFSVERLVSCSDANKPPDCEATIDRAHAGIEVTELVDQESLEQSLRGQTTWFPWNQQTFTGSIQRIIDTKEEGGSRWQGGPYYRRLLVVHSDEPYLTKSAVSGFLQGKRFKSGFFSDAVLGLSYDPSTESIPTFRLALDRT
jgi:predicted nucleotidyltransferase